MAAQPLIEEIHESSHSIAIRMFGMPRSGD
jgi:hypothetical protein